MRRITIVTAQPGVGKSTAMRRLTSASTNAGGPATRDTDDAVTRDGYRLPKLYPREHRLALASDYLIQEITKSLSPEMVIFTNLWELIYSMGFAFSASEHTTRDRSGGDPAVTVISVQLQGADTYRALSERISLRSRAAGSAFAPTPAEIELWCTASNRAADAYEEQLDQHFTPEIGFEPVIISSRAQLDSLDLAAIVTSL